MNTEIIPEKEFKYHLIKRLEGVQELTNSGDLLIAGNLTRDPVQKILSNNNNNDWFSSTFLPIIEATAIDCEKYSAGSGQIFLRLVTNLLAEDIRKNTLFKIEDHSIKETKKIIDQHASGFCELTDFEEFKRQSLCETSLKIVNDVIKDYRLGDHISVTKSLLRDTTIVKSNGYIFDNIKVHPHFLQKGAWSRKEVNIIIIDGIIESVGEIYHLLEDANKTSEPYLIICSGILPEPLNVIQNNFSRKTIDVIVGQVNSDEFSIQTMVDVGTACMFEPITALKGETISQSITRRKVKIDSVEATGAGIIIRNIRAKTATDKLLREVISKAEADLDVNHLYQKRVKCLSSSKIHVGIGRDDVSKDLNSVEEVDVFFRSCPAILATGFIKKNDVVELPDSILCLLFGKIDVQPFSRVYKALDSYASIKEQINRTGTVIKYARE
jgi:hypothetical protein